MPKKAARSSSDLSQRNLQLKQENTKLRKELEQVRTTQIRRSKRIWQKIGIVFLSSLAAAVLITGNILFWAGRSVLETKKYVAISSKVIQQPSVQEALANNITDSVFSQVNVNQLLEQNLPPRASFLAEPLASQAKTYTRQTLQTILGNEKFQDFWQEAQTNLHDRIINTIKNYKGDGVIDLNDIYQKAVSNLSDTKLSFLANTKLPASVGSITVVDATWLPAAHNIVVNLSLYRILSILIFLAATILAVLLSRNRRKQVITLGLIYTVTMLLTLVAVAITKNTLVSSATSANQAAVRDVTNIVFSSLILQTRLLLAASLFTTTLAWLSGPYRSATAIRERINLLLSGKLHNALFGSRENGLTKFVGQHQAQLFWTYTAVVGAFIIFTSLTTSSLVSFIISLGLLAIILDILAAPKTK